MATQREVENAIKEIVVDALYPSGTSAPSITNKLIKIRVGWPISEKLDIDLLAGNSQVSIFPVGTSTKNVTRFPRIAQEVERNAATLFVSVVNNTVTITGTVTVPQAVFVNLNGQFYGYQVVVTDTVNSVAANVAALIPGATAITNVITISGELLGLTSTAIVTGTVATELKRQKQVYYVSIFTPTPDDRDTIGDALDVALQRSYFIIFPDTTQAVIIFKTLNEIDNFEKSLSYQRDLIYTVEYPTMVYDVATEIGGIEVDVATLEETS